MHLVLHYFGGTEGQGRERERGKVGNGRDREREKEGVGKEEN